ncbi:MAG TPA: hypothetical protein VI386_29090 [Candidatus Sulfotelmatobacter sp.]
MMIKTFQKVALVLGTLAGPLMAMAIAQAQQNWQPLSADLAVTYTAERAKISTVACGCFWLQGGSVDAAIPLIRGLSVAGRLTGEHAASIGPGIDLSIVAFMAGPRYTFRTSRWTDRFVGSRRRTSIFGEALFGSAHGFDGAFSTSSGFKNSANSLSMQFGGGVNIRMVRNLGIRAFEMDYVRTQFRNFAGNSQNDLRVAAGVTYHLGER